MLLFILNVEILSKSVLDTLFWGCLWRLTAITLGLDAMLVLEHIYLISLLQHPSKLQYLKC